MSRRGKPRPQNPFSARIAAFDGARIPGGCTSCDAYQVVDAHAYGADVHRITVHHDQGCPELAARQGRSKWQHPS
jgi:hypothetical protein